MHTTTYPNSSYPKSNGCHCGGTCDDCASSNDTAPDGIHFPNFFAGQLLIESDFRCLIDYVRSKNRLHNRHYLGAGVVCGLQVRHDACPNNQHLVVIAPGHAIDGCGEDILLPREVKVDVAEHLRQLRKKARNGADCGDPCMPKPSTKPNGEQPNGEQPEDEPNTYEYGLYVVFNECRTKLVTPYDIGAACGGGCEPTRIVESFEIQLDCIPSPNFGSDFSNGLVKQLSCLADYEDQIKTAIEKLRQGANNVDEIAKFIESTRTCLSIVVANDHVLLGRLSNLPVLDGSNVRKYAHEFLDIVNLIIRKFTCENILPPCRVTNSNRVLIASLTVDQYCSVTKICNYVRTIIPTVPTLRYWFGDVLEDSLARICCPPVVKVKEEKVEPVVPMGQETPTEPEIQSVTTESDSISSVVQAIVRFAKLDVQSINSPLLATIDSIIQRLLRANHRLPNEISTSESALLNTSTEHTPATSSTNSPSNDTASNDTATSKQIAATRKASAKKSSSTQVKLKNSPKKKASQAKAAKKKTSKKSS